MPEPHQILLSLKQPERDILSMIVTAQRLNQRITRHSAQRYAGFDPTATRSALDKLVEMGVLTTSQGKAGHSVYSISAAFQAAAKAQTVQVSLAPAANVTGNEPVTPSFAEWMAFLRDARHKPQSWSLVTGLRQTGVGAVYRSTWQQMAFWLGLLVDANAMATAASDLAAFLDLAPEDQVAQILWVAQQDVPDVSDLVINICRQCQAQDWYNLIDLSRLRRAHIKNLSEWNANDPTMLQTVLAWPLAVGLIPMALAKDGRYLIRPSQILLDWHKAGAALQPPPLHRGGDRLLTLVLQTRLGLDNLERAWGITPSHGHSIAERMTTLLSTMSTESRLMAHLNAQASDAQQLLKRLLASKDHPLHLVTPVEESHLRHLQTIGLVFLRADTGWRVPVDLIAPLQACFVAKAESDKNALLVEEAPWIRHDGLVVHSDLLVYLLSLPELQHTASSSAPGTRDYLPDSRRWLLRDEGRSDFSGLLYWIQQLAISRQWVQTRYPEPTGVNRQPLLAFLKHPWKTRHFELLQHAQVNAGYSQISLRVIANTLLSHPTDTWVRVSWVYRFLQENPTLLTQYGAFWRTQDQGEIKRLVDSAFSGPLLWLGLLDLAAQESGVVAVRVTPLGRELLSQPFEKSAARFTGDDPSSLNVILRPLHTLSIQNHPAAAALIYRAARLGNVSAVGPTWEIELLPQKIKQASASDVAELQELLRPYRIELKRTPSNISS